MRAQTNTVSSATTSSEIVVYPRSGVSPALSFHLLISGVATVTIQFTIDGENWIDSESYAGLTASKAGNFLVPIHAVRFNVTSYTSGTIKMTVMGA